MLLLELSLLLALSTTNLVLGQTCYNPDHSVSANHIACNAGAKESHCCYETDICLTNGYCLQTTSPWSNRIGRGACTDATWSSSACPTYCSDTSTDRATGLHLAYDSPNGVFCCSVPYNQSTSRCELATLGSTKPFQLPAGNVIFNRADGDAITHGTLQSNTTTSNSTGSSNDTTSCPSVASSASGSSNITTIAAGIAIPLGVLLIAALVTIAVLWSKLRKAQRAQRPAFTGKDAGVGARGVHSSHEAAYGPAPSYEHKGASQQHQDAWSGARGQQADTTGHQGYAMHEAPGGQAPIQADSRPLMSELDSRENAGS